VLTQLNSSEIEAVTNRFVCDDAMDQTARGKGMLSSSRVETPHACDAADAARANVIAKANSPRL
jgi:hypothetical protein